MIINCIYRTISDKKIYISFDVYLLDKEYIFLFVLKIKRKKHCETRFPAKVKDYKPFFVLFLNEPNLSTFNKPFCNNRL